MDNGAEQETSWSSIIRVRRLRFPFDPRSAYKVRLASSNSISIELIQLNFQADMLASIDPGVAHPGCL